MSGSARLTFAWLGSLTTLILAGAGLAILAGRQLSSSEYSAFIAFTAISGVLVQGVGGAIEQHTLLYTRFGSCDGRNPVIRVSIIAYIIIVVLVTMPIANWQDRFFDPMTDQVVAAVIIGAPALFATCVMRGRLTAHGFVAESGRSILILSVLTIGLPITFKILGASWASAMIFGQAFAWGAPSLYLMKFRHKPSQAPSEESVQGMNLGGLSSLFVVNNLLLLSSLLSSQILIKATSVDLSSDEVAQSQLIISLSCLTATLGLGVTPLILARLPSSVINERGRFLGRVLVPGMVVSVLALGMIAVLREPLIRAIIGDAVVLDGTEVLVLSLPGTLLTSSVLLNSFFISNSMILRAVIGWSSGLLALWLPASLLTPDSVISTSTIILGSTAFLFHAHVVGFLIGRTRSLSVSQDEYEN
jgi:hypothetical protein